MLEVLCINNKSKPNEIPISQWLEQGTIYTAVALCKSKITGDMYFKLEEVQPPTPYMGYKVDRFEVLGGIAELLAELTEIEETL